MAHHLAVRHWYVFLDSNGAPPVGAPLVIFFYIAMAHQEEVRH